MLLLLLRLLIAVATAATATAAFVVNLVCRGLALVAGWQALGDAVELCGPLSAAALVLDLQAGGAILVSAEETHHLQRGAVPLLMLLTLTLPTTIPAVLLLLLLKRPRCVADVGPRHVDPFAAPSCRELAGNGFALFGF